MTEDRDLPPEWYLEDDGYGERAQAFDEGVTHVLGMFARYLDAKDWYTADGSETWEGDVNGTIGNILRSARVEHEENGSIARHPEPVRTVLNKGGAS